MPIENGDERRRRNLEELLELRRSFGTLGRRLGTRQRPIRPGLVPFPQPPAEADRDAGASADEDQEETVATTVRRAGPVASDSFSSHVPDPPGPAGDEPFRIPEPTPARRRPPWRWLVALALVFALGMAVDHTLLQPAAVRPSPPAPTRAVEAPSAPSSSAAAAHPPASVPASCLVTAQIGDVLVDMLVKKTRGIEVTRALESYTKASQTCRKEASSR